MNKSAKKRDMSGRSQSGRSGKPARSHASVYRSAPAISPSTRDALKEKATEVVEAAGLFLEDFTCGRQRANVLVRATIDVIDGPGGVSSDQLADVSRLLSQAFDQMDLIEGAYTLEVSSPGVERELLTPRHYSRSLGRLISCRLADGRILSGYVRSASGQAILLELQENHAQGGKKGKAGEKKSVEIPLSDIVSARVMVDFSRLSGAEENASADSHK